MIDLGQAVYTHGFVVEFENQEDLEYYLHKDPAHLAFKEVVKELGEGVKTGVMDFVPGGF